MIQKIPKLVFLKNIPTQKLLWWGVGTIVIALVLFNSKDALFGTKLSISTTKDGATLQNQFLPIRGTAKHARTLSINGREVAFDRSGNFADGVLLSPGYNIVEVTLRDQFGNQKNKIYHLVLDQVPPVVATVENHYQ